MVHARKRHGEITVRTLLYIALFLTASVMLGQSSDGDISANNSAASHGNGKGHTPNILFIILDDVGIDQLRAFGYGGVDAARTPNIDVIARAGVRFRNAWAMPECSPSRAVFFEGRYPLRTNVFGALLDDDLANSQVSPFEATTPKILKTRGYDSGDFGKFHLGEKTNNPFGERLVQSLGWDYFDGFLEGAPHPIDATAGGVDLSAPYSCGFVPNKVDGGADNGSCRFVNNSCQDLTATTAHRTPGRYCLEQGGIFVPETSCRQTPTSTPDFSRTNGYYVWPRVINYPNGRLATSTARGFVGEATTTSAVNWINDKNSAKKNWMATVAFPQIHTPYQQVPESLLPSGSPDLSHLNCTGNRADNFAAYHLLSNQMLESMDAEIGRLLVQTGLARYKTDGRLDYHPERTDTMVIVAGDNGTYAFGVKPPFNPSRAKGFVYQTGVWVPLIVAGPLVNSPDRNVESMVNIADLFQLFGEIAGIDVRKAVPATHTLDSESMIRYLTNPGQPSIRQTNFTQTGRNIHVSAPSPCVLQTGTATCAQLFTSAALCADEGGDWYGPDPNNPIATSYPSCCAVQQAVKDGTITKYGDSIDILPDFQNAIRNDKYKLVQLKSPNCSEPPDDHGNFPDITSMEFYEINEDRGTPMLDNKDNALCADGTENSCPNGLTANERATFEKLSFDMKKLLESEPECLGDGNEDKVVNGKDVAFWYRFARFTKQGSSWYDFNLDGKTNKPDLAIILENLSTRCRAKK